MIRTILTNLKRSAEPLNYGRKQVVSAAVRHVRTQGFSQVRLLDVGLGTATDAINIRDALRSRCGVDTELHGIDVYMPHVEAARSLGIRVYTLDIERDVIPVDDASFEIVVANQVIEHVKEVFWVFSEFSRVLKPGGMAIVAVPNLASLHNRIALLLGMQPTSIEPLSAHVRGFARDGFKRLVECDGYFRLTSTAGSNFYPFPPSVSRLLCRLFPSMSVCSIYTLVRTEKPGMFISVLQDRFFETPYYRGAEGAPASAGCARTVGLVGASEAAETPPGPLGTPGDHVFGGL